MLKIYKAFCSNALAVSVSIPHPAKRDAMLLSSNIAPPHAHKHGSVQARKNMIKFAAGPSRQHSRRCSSAGAAAQPAAQDGESDAEADELADEEALLDALPGAARDFRWTFLSPATCLLSM